MRKKIYAFVFAFTGLTVTHAQITITNADMPVVNDTFRLSSTTDHWTIDASVTGTSHTWDFSFLTPEAQNLDTCRDVSSFPLAYQFYFNNSFLYPLWKANFGIRGQEFDFGGMLSLTDVYDFYKSSSSKYQNVGFGAKINGTAASVRKDPIENIYSLPLNFGDSSYNYSRFEVEIPTLGTYIQKKYKHGDVDGWGTLTLPMGTFPVLRMKFVVNITDSVYVDAFGFGFENPRPAEIHYLWLGQNKDVPLLQINTDSASGAVTQIIYQDHHVPLAGIKEPAAAFSYSVYPNPVSHTFTVTAAEPVQTISVYDLFGRKVLSTNPMSQQATVSLPAGMPTGTYVLECTSAKGKERQRLVVTR